MWGRHCGSVFVVTPLLTMLPMLLPVCLRLLQVRRVQLAQQLNQQRMAMAQGGRGPGPIGPMAGMPFPGAPGHMFYPGMPGGPSPRGPPGMMPGMMPYGPGGPGGRMGPGR